jgi:hypothetical protein
LKFLSIFKAGGIAGICVDVVLFPLDTIKTRIQSSQGFFRAGGFHGVYSGLGSAATGSFPAGRLSNLISIVDLLGSIGGQGLGVALNGCELPIDICRGI